jgi:hypothetical protein
VVAASARTRAGVTESGGTPSALASVRTDASTAWRWP